MKLGSRLNEELWERGIEKPPRRVRVKAVIEDQQLEIEQLQQYIAS